MIKESDNQICVVWRRSVIFEINSHIIYFALNHPIRRWIIELLEACGTLSCSELRSLLNINLGRLCYHLDNLMGLIEQDNNQQYMLSRDGKRAYRLLKRNNARTIKFQPNEPSYDSHLLRNKIEK